MYSKIEEARLEWIRCNQKQIRAELYQTIYGKRIVIPPTFTGGPRWMQKLYQESMAIVRKLENRISSLLSRVIRSGKKSRMNYI